MDCVVCVCVCVCVCVYVLVRNWQLWVVVNKGGDCLKMEKRREMSVLCTVQYRSLVSNGLF